MCTLANNNVARPEGEDPLLYLPCKRDREQHTSFMEDMLTQDTFVANGDQSAPMHPAICIVGSCFRSNTNQQLLLSMIIQIHGLKAACTMQTNALEIWGALLGDMTRLSVIFKAD